VEEARNVIRRLERIEALQAAEAPAAELLVEVRHLLREGEAWLAAEHVDRPASSKGGRTTAEAEGRQGGGRTSLHGREMTAAAKALAGCRDTLTTRSERKGGEMDARAL
jgi:hypothetical protein